MRLMPLRACRAAAWLGHKVIVIRPSACGQSATTAKHGPSAGTWPEIHKAEGQRHRATSRQDECRLPHRGHFKPGAKRFSRALPRHVAVRMMTPSGLNLPGQGVGAPRPGLFSSRRWLRIGGTTLLVQMALLVGAIGGMRQTHTPTECVCLSRQSPMAGLVPPIPPMSRQYRQSRQWRIPRSPEHKKAPSGDSLAPCGHCSCRT
jgi:hypothetical protein